MSQGKNVSESISLDKFNQNISFKFADISTELL